MIAREAIFAMAAQRGRVRRALTGDGMATSSERNIRVVVATAALGSLAAAIVLAANAARPDFHESVTAAALLIMAVAARHYPLQIAFRRRMVTDIAPLFAAVLLLSAPLAAAVAFLSIFTAELTAHTGTRIDARQVLFNSCQAFLTSAAAAGVYATIATQRLPSSDASVMVAAAAAAATMLVAGDALVFTVVWAQLGLRFRRMLWDWVRGRADLPSDATLYAAGFVGALAGSIHVWLLVLLVVPTPVLYRAMRNQVALRRQTREAVEALADIVDERDPYTFGHCRRVAEFTRELCQQMGLSPDLTDEIVLAARVHDVGKIGIRDSVLQKPDRLTDDEFDHIKEHPEIGARLTARFPDFAAGTRYIRHHHERFDGTGYPAGLKGKDIPLGARIIAVADTYDAMTSTRVYRAGLDDHVTRLEMERVRGVQLDPEVVDAWFAHMAWEFGEKDALAA